MELRKGKLLYEEKTKKIYPTNDPNRLIVHFKDEVVGLRGSKAIKIKNKGAHNNAISAALFQFLESYHVGTHFVKVYKPNEMVVKKMDVLPLRVMVWNYAMGDLSKRYGISEGEQLAYPVFEYFFKNKKLKNPMIGMDHACAFGVATPEEMRTIDRNARKINAVLKSFFDRRALKLACFELCFGRRDGEILVGDELSPDTCSFYDLQDETSPGLKPIRFDSENAQEAYGALKDRICQ